MFSSIVSSPRASLSPKQALDIARVYMENANNAADPEIALVFCHDTEVSLAQAKKTIKHAKDHTVLADIITAYVDLGKLLERRKHSVPAQASYKKARKLGTNPIRCVRGYWVALN
ncbi:hypothetical protein B0O80DRAFT_431755 [Mortierella sp. GBAus27b]|nr:hypothetical protein B0O80DRAFT_431755 [Mortierella sp. GBAus27b]